MADKTPTLPIAPMEPVSCCSLSEADKGESGTAIPKMRFDSRFKKIIRVV